MSQHKDVMDRPQADRPQTTRPHMGGTQTDTQQSKRLYPWELLNPERCESVELDHSIRERVQSHRLTQDTLDRTVILKQAQSGAPATGVDTGDLQMAILEKQRQELLYINKKWAEQYQAMTQYYKEKVHKLKKLLTLYDGHQMKKEEEESDRGEWYKVFERDLPQTKDAAENIQGQNCEKLLKAESEAEDLRMQNTTLTRRGQQQDGEIKRLNKALSEAIETPAPAKEDSGTGEEIWRHQAQVYKEDFLKERRDREKLKEKHTQLDQRFRKVHTELNTLKSQVTWTPTLARSSPACVCTHGARLHTREGEAKPSAHPHTQHPHHHPQPHNKPST